LELEPSLCGKSGKIDLPDETAEIVKTGNESGTPADTAAHLNGAIPTRSGSLDCLLKSLRKLSLFCQGTVSLVSSLSPLDDVIVQFSTAAISLEMQW
jgi:hypothetical protein